MNFSGTTTESFEPGDQEAVLAKNLYDLCLILIERKIPFSFIVFPRFAEDPVYLYQHLGLLLTGVSFATFRTAFDRVRRPEWIGRFEK